MSQLLQRIKNFSHSVNIGYSETAIARSSKMVNKINCCSNYADLYYAFLLHISGDNNDMAIRSILQDVYQYSNEGIIYEKASFIQRAKHDDSYIKFHLSSIFYQLADRYYREIGEIEFFKSMSVATLNDLFSSFDYSDAWNVSNVLMACGTMLAYNESVQESRSALLDHVLEHIDNLRDIKMGIWVGKRNISMLNSIAAAFHYLPLYSYRRKKLDNVSKLVDMVLSMALPNGHFSSPAGYACIDYDCISLLYYALSDCGIKADSVQGQAIFNAAENCKQAMLSLQNSDGGFPEYGDNEYIIDDVLRCIIAFWHHRCFGTFYWNAKKIVLLSIKRNRQIVSNSVAACSSGMRESNTFATWFRYMTLALAEDIIEMYSAKTEKSSNEETSRERLAPSRRLMLPGLAYF